MFLVEGLGTPTCPDSLDGLQNVRQAARHELMFTPSIHACSWGAGTGVGGNPPFSPVFRLQNPHHAHSHEEKDLSFIPLLGLPEWGQGKDSYFDDNLVL